MEDGTLEEVDRGIIPEGTRIFNYRFIDELNKADKGFRMMSRLIEQNFRYEEAASIGLSR